MFVLRGFVLGLALARVIGVGPVELLSLPSPPLPLIRSLCLPYPTRTEQVAQRAAGRASRRPGPGGGRQDGVDRGDRVDRIDRDANPYGEGEEHRWRGSAAAEQVEAGLACLGVGLRVGLGWLELLVSCSAVCWLPR